MSTAAQGSAYVKFYVKSLGVPLSGAERRWDVSSRESSRCQRWGTARRPQRGDDGYIGPGQQLRLVDL